MRSTLVLLGILLIISNLTCGKKKAKGLRCRLPREIKKEILRYQPFVNFLINHVTNGSEANQTYKELAKFTDKFGARISGSNTLERALIYMQNRLQKEDLDNVHPERVMVPHWVRGNEVANLVYPRYKPLTILGLGGSIGTPREGITADVLVVNSFDELKAKAKWAKGKIVVYNQPWVNYSTSVQYRQFGAAEAAKVGAVASLVRSVTPFSINSPHTGWQDYEENVRKIPTASITVEDAQMFRRMSKRGVKLTIYLYMEAQTYPLFPSRNMIAEIEGTTFPDQVVMVSGHLDSWDVGQGAMDDGGGAFISWRALSILRRLKMKAKRTLRVALWTGEEEGIWGGQAYFNAHEKEKDNFNLVMESDIGTFKPLGLTFSGKNKTAQCIVKQVLKLFKSINATKLKIANEGPDIEIWENAGVPGSSLINQNEKYFYFHHSDGDSMTVEDPYNLDLCTAFWTATAYIFADLEDMLPR